MIDDDKPICWLLEKLLGRSYEVITMSDGLKAMLWLSDGNQPDLIITDVNMPNLDGLELVKNLKKSGLYRDIPVVMLSGWCCPEKKDLCMEHGAFEYIVKPFDPKELLEVVGRATNSQQGQPVFQVA